MAFSSRRRNYLLTPHRKDGLIEWMKSMLNHSFVLDALDTTAADTFSHFEMLIDEHRLHYQNIENDNSHNHGNGSATANHPPSRLKQLVPTVGTFHTHLPLRRAFVAYNKKYSLTKRKFITISFNELRHILNLAQIMALRSGVCEDTGGVTQVDVEEEQSLRKSLTQWANSPGALGVGIGLNSSMSNGTGSSGGSGSGAAMGGLIPPVLPPEISLGAAAVTNGTSANGTTLRTMQSMDSAKTLFKGPKMITFDGDQTLYSDGANFEGNPQLANYLYLLLRHGVTLAVVTAAGYEYNTERYEMRLSGLLAYFKSKNLPAEDCERFYLFGGECNFLLKLGSDYRLHPVKEFGPGGWKTATKFIQDSPANWEEDNIQSLLDISETSVSNSIKDLKIRGRIIRKKRSVGLIPNPNDVIPREALDETVLRVHGVLDEHVKASIKLPFCAFNGGRDVWIDVGNKRVGVDILAAYLDINYRETIHVGDQFLNTGNDYAARSVCPCIWITNPDETTYILKSILRLAGVPLDTFPDDDVDDEFNASVDLDNGHAATGGTTKALNFSTLIARQSLTDLDGNGVARLSPMPNTDN